MQSKLLLAAAAATGAVAMDLSGTLPRALRRAAELGPRDQDECLAVAAQNTGVLADFPMLPTAVASEALDIPTVTDPCSFPTVTGPAGAVITSYSSALMSWKDAHVTELRSIYQACSDVPELSSALAQYGDALCSTVLVEITSSDAGNATATAPTTATGTVSVTETDATVTATDATVTATDSPSGTASGETTASGDAASTTESPAAAPKETGFFVAAAAAAVGVVGAVMI